ncbi:MAG: hypothetical protein PVI10_09865 [Methyloceanibacter sp.]|mgnify:FL=1
MRSIALMVLAGVCMLSSAAAEAAQRWIEDACFAKAAKRSFNGRGEREQFMANCIADLSANSPQERRKYKRRYR